MPSSSSYKFGEFELDSARFELRRNNEAVKLERIPMELLILLVASNGNVVSRQEIVERLWGKDVYLDTEHGINTAIRKIRQALKDDPERPRFVQTVTGKGYRFIVTLNGGGNAVAPVTMDMLAVTSQKVDQFWLLRSSIAVILIAVVAGALVWRSVLHKARTLTEKDTIVLAGFSNTTGDPAFDGALQQALSADLAQSPFLSVLSEEQVQQTLLLMGQKPGAILTPSIAQEVCQRTSSTAFLEGSIAQIGAQYLLVLKSVNCATSRLMTSTEVHANDKNHVLAALKKLAVVTRNNLGESLASIQKFDVPQERVTTSSLDALRAYSLGMRHLAAYEHREAALQFQEAVRLDPNFASAYMQLAHTEEYLGNGPAIDENIDKAYALRDRVSQRESFHITIRYLGYRLGDLDGQVSTAERWAETFPRDAEARLWLTDKAMWKGDWEEAARQGRLTLDLDPTYTMNYYNLAVSQVALGHLDAATTTCDQAAARKLDNSTIHMVRYWIAFVRHDSKKMDEEVKLLEDIAQQRPDIEPDLLKAQMATELYFGRRVQARGFFQRAMDSTVRAGTVDDNVNSVGLESFWSFLNAELGNTDEARTYARRALAQHKDPHFGARLALVLARSGEILRAQKSADDFEAKFHTGSFSLKHSLPVARSSIALARGNGAEAIELLRPVTGDRYWWGPDDPSSMDGLLPAYLRGKAYLQMRQGKEAAAEFQRFIDHPGIVVNSPLGPLARVGLARAYLFQGDVTKARAAYQAFLTLWKDADPDIPILQQAKSEYANLR